MLLVGNDGGVHGTTTANLPAPQWFNMDTGLNTIEFYAGDISGNFVNSAAPQAVFESAKKASAQRDVKSLAAAEIANDEATGEIKHAGTHMFRKDSDRWVDLRHYGKLTNLPKDRPGDLIFPRLQIPLNECVPRAPQPPGCQRVSGF